MKLHEILLAVLIAVLIILTIILMPIAIDWVQDETSDGWGVQPVVNENANWVNITIENWDTELNYYVFIISDNESINISANDTTELNLTCDHFLLICGYEDGQTVGYNLLFITICDYNKEIEYSLMGSIVPNQLIIAYQSE